MNEIVPSPGGGFHVTEAVPQSSALPTGFYKREFTDDTNPLAYDFVILHGKSRVFVREMGEAGLQDYFDQVNSFAAEQAVLRATPPPLDAEARAEMLLKNQRAYPAQILARCIVGWDKSRTYSPESLALLPDVDKRTLALKIVRVAQVGEEEAVPLADGS